MAEFCLECWEEINPDYEIPANYILSKELELCEGCGEWKHVLEPKQRFSLLRKLLPFLFE